jgi:hypothetical protein
MSHLAPGRVKMFVEKMRTDVCSDARSVRGSPHLARIETTAR